MRRSYDTIPRTRFNRVKYWICWFIVQAHYVFYRITKTGDKPMNSRSLQGRCLDFYETMDFQAKLPETFGLSPQDKSKEGTHENI